MLIKVCSVHLKILNLLLKVPQGIKIKVFNKSLFLTITVAQQILGTSDHLCSS